MIQGKETQATRSAIALSIYDWIMKTSQFFEWDELMLGRRINVNKKLITRVSLEEWAKMKGQTDWVKIDAMTEEEIERKALDDPDNQPLTDEFWDEAEVIFPEVNVMAKE